VGEAYPCLAVSCLVEAFPVAASREVGAFPAVEAYLVVEACLGEVRS